MKPPTNPSVNRCPVVTPAPIPYSEFVLHCEREAGHTGDHVSGDCIWADEEARIAFALILDMAERAQDFEDDFARVKAEDHAGDEVHCSCVIHLRRHIEELKAEIAALKQPFSLHIDPDGERVWRRGEQCRHERTYTAEATICRRCNKVV